MANKRMFTMKIVDSDAFLDMPLSSQCLYFHLNMRADDDGFIRNGKSIMRMLDAEENDIQNLIKNGYLVKCSDSLYEVIGFLEMNRESGKQRIRNTKKYKEWRKKILERDNRTCQMCGGTENIKVHHKIRFRDCFEAESILYDTENGVCLCGNCHEYVHEGGNYRNG